MVGLIAQLFVGGDWVDAGAVLVSDTGVPVTAAVPSYDGEGIPDTYSLSFSVVVPSVSAVVKVATGSPNNPYADSVGVSVLLDNSTVYLSIIPGVSLKFSSSGSFTGSWQAIVTIGLPLGALNAFTPDAGTPTDSTRVRVRNTGLDPGQDCVVRLLPQVVRVKRTGVVFVIIHGSAESAVEKLVSGSVSPYGVTATSVAGSGVSKTMTLDVDGDPFNVINLTDSSTSDSTGLNVVDFYQVTSGPLTDLVFKLSEDTVEDDTENVLVFSHKFTQVAPDDGGVPGDWESVDDVVLTEVGQAAGVITADGVAYFHVRAVVPAGSNSQSNPYVASIAIQGSAAGSAGWTD